MLLLLALAANAVGAAEIPLGAIIMQLRSKAEADAPTLNRRVEAVTADFLNQYFKAYYTRTEQGASDYFEKVDLSTNSLGVHGVEGSYITTIEIEGTLSFNAETKLPSSFFIETLLRNAFMGQNEQLYVDQLLKVESDEFLQNLTYLIIDINKSNVAESLLREDGTVTSPVVDTASMKTKDSGGNKAFSEKWITVMIYAGSVALALLLLACTSCLLRRCRERKAATAEDGDSDDDDANGDEPIKIIHLPVKKKKTSFLRSTENDIDLISPNSAGTTPTIAGSLSDQMDRPPPSPQRSMSSQCSSIFTYSGNMSKMTYSKTNNDVASRVPSIGSRFSLDMPSIDLGAWRGGREDPPAFGADISVIEAQKDLSLIPEENLDIEAGVRDMATGYSHKRNVGSGSRYLLRNSRAVLGARQSQSRSSHRSESYFYSGKHVSNSDVDSDCALDTSTEDVIDDLKNLSLQIQRERSARRNVPR